MKNSVSHEIAYKLHFAAYVFALMFSLVLALVQRGGIATYDFAGFMFITLSWGMVFALHTHHYAERKGYGRARRDERQAYRDGFNDALRELRNNQNSHLPSYLSIDDYLGEDGEVYDEPVYEKYKRS
jgi:hypothetical protein